MIDCDDFLTNKFSKNNSPEYMLFPNKVLEWISVQGDCFYTVLVQPVIQYHL